MSYSVIFSAKPHITVKELSGAEEKKRFLSGLLKKLEGYNPQELGTKVSHGTQRRLLHIDESFGFCIVIFDVRGSEVIVYLVTQS